VNLDRVTIAAGLRTIWPEVEVMAVRELTGGEWATMACLDVTGVPEGVPEKVVLRIAPDAEMGAKEIAVQQAVRATGVETPEVHAAGGTGGPFPGPWAVMDFVDGRSLLAGLDGPAALRQAVPLLRRLPAQLADTMATIHRIDPAPVVEQVRAAVPSVALSVGELWDHLAAGADLLGNRNLAEALDRLRERQPAPSETVLCHGDLHPFNLLAQGDQVVVLDWTAAVVAPPAFDVAFTWLLLRHPPLVAPAAARPMIGAAAVAMSRRFVRRYQTMNPARDLRDLSWYAAVHATRVLIDLASWESTGDPRSRRHPWRLVAPGATRVLQRATGLRLTGHGRLPRPRPRWSSARA
jgi:aminoglycoside phosphotransferase (APT) family kinase protein